MRIIAGELKNRTLKTPKGKTTRPTSGKVRGSVFNILQNQTEGARFLDLFAGSGAMGIEALSRGAKKATFVEKDRSAAKALRENLADLGLNQNATLLQTDVKKAFSKLEKEAPFDIIYIDPPYLLDIAPLLEEVSCLLEKEGILIVEQGKDSQLTPIKLSLLEERHFGDTVLFFFTLPN